jgi:hypothetical protein
MSLVLSGDSPSLSSYQGGALTSGTAQASTSGTSIDFTSIPSWVKRITVMFNSFSTNGTSNYQLQLGAGSVTTTGYTSYNSVIQNGGTPVVSANITTGFVIGANNASIILYGAVRFHNITGNTWVAEGTFTGTGAASTTFTTAGSIALAGVLDRVRVTTVNGTDTFDLGLINILYE